MDRQHRVQHVLVMAMYVLAGVILLAVVSAAGKTEERRPSP